MKKASAWLWVVPFAASSVLAGCGADDTPDASPTSTATSTPTTTSAPTTPSASATTASAQPTTDTAIPAAARAHTPAGAAAFVVYFHDQLNVAWGQPRVGLLTPLSLPSCKTCGALESNAAELVAANRRVQGHTVRIDSADPGATESNGDQTVVITGAQLKTSVVDPNGKTVRDIASSRIRSLATTRWTDGGWRVGEIKVLK